MYNKKLYLYNHIGYIRCETIYSYLLKKFRRKNKYPIMTMTDLEKIQDIARQAFPEQLQQICKFKSIEDLVYYCYCQRIEQIYYVVTNEWFIIVANHHHCYELVECAAASGKCTEIYRIVGYLANNFKHKPIIADCREKTSLPIFRMLEKHGRIKILSDLTRVRVGETLHYIKFKTLRRKRIFRKGSK